jgi:hypothetical protein
MSYLSVYYLIITHRALDIFTKHCMIQIHLSADMSTRALEADNTVRKDSLVRETFPGNDTHSSHSGERRSAHPEGEKFRAQFSILADMIHRCTVDPLAKRETGEYTYNDEKITETLAAEIETLKSQDALIGLMLLLDREKKGDKRIEKRKVGCYKLVAPSAKALNDIYLGPTAKDEFVTELHAIIAEHLGNNQASLLRATFKTGIFEIDADEENNIESKLSEIPREAANLLLKHIDKRRRSLMERLEQDGLGKIYKNIGALERLRDAITENGKIDIAFGFDDVGKTDSDIWMSIRNAECAANLAAIGNCKCPTENGNRENEPQLCAANYSHAAMMKALCFAYLSLSEAIDTASAEPKILDDWQPFFRYDPTSMEIRMKEEMIGKYRKLDQYRKSDEYLEATRTEPEKEEFEKKLSFFEAYYKLINVIDVLKNFTAGNFDAYLKRIRRIVTLIQTAETEIQSGTPNGETKRHLLAQIKEQLESSFKDEGAKIVGTTRAMVKALMQNDQSIMIFGDAIDFGILNQRSYESSALRLFNMLDLSPEDIEKMGEDMRAFHAIVEQKTAAAASAPEFEQEILRIGDTGSRQLRKNERDLLGMLSGNPTANADGGDEATVIYNAEECGTLPEEEILRKIQEASYRTKMRIAVVYGMSRISPMPTGSVTKEHREQIIRFLTAKHRAEIEHALIKESSISAKAQLRAAYLSGDSTKIKAAKQQSALIPIAALHLRNTK